MTDGGAWDVIGAEQREQVTTLAMDLAREGRTGELTELLDHSVPVDLTDGDGNSLVMLAAYHGRAETVTALVGRGADVDLPNRRGQTPVAGALFKGEDVVVRTLVAAGADLDAGTPTGRQTAAMFGADHLIGGSAEPGQA